MPTKTIDEEWIVKDSPEKGTVNIFHMCYGKPRNEDSPDRGKGRYKPRMGMWPIRETEDKTVCFACEMEVPSHVKAYIP